MCESSPAIFIKTYGDYSCTDIESKIVHWSSSFEIVQRVVLVYVAHCDKEHPGLKAYLIYQFGCGLLTDHWIDLPHGNTGQIVFSTSAESTHLKSPSS